VAAIGFSCRRATPSAMHRSNTTTLELQRFLPASTPSPSASTTNSKTSAVPSSPSPFQSRERGVDATLRHPERSAHFALRMFLRSEGPEPQPRSGSSAAAFLRVLFLAALVTQVHPWRSLRADNGYDAWLRYAPLTAVERAKYDSLPKAVTVLGDSPLLQTAQAELTRGISGMLQRKLRVEKGPPRENAIILGTLADLHSTAPHWHASKELREDGYWLANDRINGHNCVIIAGATDRGTLYGVFALLRKIVFAEDLTHLQETQEPANPIRWVNEWGKLDGSIERGYGGRSIFFENGSVRADLSRASAYARLLASVGINACVVNNVNADPRVLAPDFLAQLARIAYAFRPWGVRLGISVDLSSPKSLGGLDTFDPLDPRVQSWWKQKADEIYRLIPDFAGFLIKADSEGRPGPSRYGRTPADAANVVARALQPHGGIVMYRAFVYDHHLDWRNSKNDRARAAYDIFHPLDGKFNDNVIVQIKNGPIDFQVREPVSPLLGGLEKTNEAIELQITQEYTGQQRHLCFLVPLWKEALDFDIRVQDPSTPVKNIVSSQVFHRALGGFAGVANVGLDANWLGNPMAMANLYGFARLAWNPNLRRPLPIPCCCSSIMCRTPTCCTPARLSSSTSMTRTMKASNACANLPVNGSLFAATLTMSGMNLCWHG